MYFSSFRFARHLKKILNKLLWMWFMMLLRISHKQLAFRGMIIIFILIEGDVGRCLRVLQRATTGWVRWDSLFYRSINYLWLKHLLHLWLIFITYFTDCSCYKVPWIIIYNDCKDIFTVGCIFDWSELVFVLVLRGLYKIDDDCWVILQES